MNRREAEKASTCRRLLYMVAELAATFVDRFPDIAKEAMGRDSGHVRWYREMLVATEPDGLVYAYADRPGKRDRLELFHGSSVDVIPLPPTFNADNSA